MNSYATHLPHLGWPVYALQKAVQVDQFVLMDAQPMGKSGLNRITVPTHHGLTHVTLPMSKCGSTTLIDHARPVDLELWVKKATKTMQNLYGRCGGWKEERPYWEDHWERVLDNPVHSLSNIACMTLQYLLSAVEAPKTALVLETQLISSEYHENHDGWVAEIGHALGASEYCAGDTEHHDPVYYPAFRDKQITVSMGVAPKNVWQSLQGEQMDRSISSFDPLFSEGRAKLREVLGLPPV